MALKYTLEDVEHLLKELPKQSKEMEGYGPLFDGRCTGSICCRGSVPRSAAGRTGHLATCSPVCTMSFF